MSVMPSKVAAKKVAVRRRRPAAKRVVRRKSHVPRRSFGRRRPGEARRTNTEIIRNIGGAPDRQLVRLQYATTSAFSTVGGAASYLQLKLNSVYRPYAGNTDSDGGQASMFSRYTRCLVRGSKVTIRLWSSATGSVPEPFRIVLVPCTSTNYTTLSAIANIVTICDMPHATHKLVSPGSAMPTIQAYSSVNTVRYGNMKQGNLDLDMTALSATTGTDPTAVFYWLVGYQNMAGTTNLDLQAEVIIEHYCEFFQPLMSSLPQVAWDGKNEYIPEAKVLTAPPAQGGEADGTVRRTSDGLDRAVGLTSAGGGESKQVASTLLAQGRVPLQLQRIPDSDRFVFVEAPPASAQPPAQARSSK